MQVLQVGRKAPSFLSRQKDNLPIGDGAAFTLLEDGQPFIAFYLRNMTEEEAEHIGGSKIESSFWYGYGFWLGMLKIGKILQDLSFDPMVHYQNYRSFSPDLFRENRSVTIIGVDTAKMTIKTLRAATYPWKFLESLQIAFDKFIPHVDYSNLYQELNNEFDRLPLQLLWNQFIPGGCFGEKKSERK
jgi:hypothetical protein